MREGDSFRLPARMTNKSRHCPAPYYWIGRAIQWNMPSGVAGLLCFDAALFDARMTGREGGAKTPLERNTTGNELVNTYARIARPCVV